MDFYKDKFSKELEEQINGRAGQIARNIKLIEIASGDDRWKFHNENITLTTDKLKFQEILEHHKSRQSIERLTMIIIGITAVNILFPLMK